MHPLINDLSTLKDSELESRVNDLTRKYFMTYNPEVQQQISAALDTYKLALAERRRIAFEQAMELRHKDLDKLIKID